MEEDHRREPGVMDRYRGRAAISMLVSAGQPGPPVLHLVDQVRGPEAVVMERSKLSHVKFKNVTGENYF